MCVFLRFFSLTYGLLDVPISLSYTPLTSKLSPESCSSFRDSSTSKSSIGQWVSRSPRLRTSVTISETVPYETVPVKIKSGPGPMQKIENRHLQELHRSMAKEGGAEGLAGQGLPGAEGEQKQQRKGIMQQYWWIILPLMIMSMTASPPEPEGGGGGGEGAGQPAPQRRGKTAKA